MTPYLSPADPTHERFDALSRAVINGTIAATGAVVGGSALGGMGSPLIAVLLVAGAPFALRPIVRWRRTAAQRRALPVGHLSPAWREALGMAAAATARIEAAHRDAPPGAVADHLAVLRDTAGEEVRRLHAAASRNPPLDPHGEDPRLEVETRAARRLLELAGSAERLRAAQRGDEGIDELDALVEATDRLAETLRDPGLAGPTSARGADGTPAPAWPTSDR